MSQNVECSNPNSILHSKHASWRGTSTGIGLFVLQPVIFVLGFVLSIERASNGLLLLMVGAILAILSAGWVKGFPRWVFPYWGMALAFSSLLVNMGISNFKIWGHTFQRNELWGGRAWIPVGIAGLAAILLSRSVRPLRQLVKGVWHDWTRLSFGLYGVMLMMLFIAFDEVHGSGPYVALSSLILAAGALAYMRSTRTWQRALALWGGFTLSWTAATVCLARYWDGRQQRSMEYPGNWRSVVEGMADDWTKLVTWLIAPVILGFIYHLLKARQTAQGAF